MKSNNTSTVKSEGGKTNSFQLLVNGIIVTLLLVAGYFSYVFLTRASTTGNAGDLNSKLPPVIQLDVLNGCGVKGVGMKCTNYLREQGFDVVEVKNYKTFTVPQTLVVDRVGNMDVARTVAHALGIPEKHVIQQINPDYFVDVSVIIGSDYLTLRAAH